MKKVLVVAYYFPPLGWSGVQRTLKFIKYMREFNWEPIILTVGDTPFKIKDNSLNEEVPENIKIIRIDDEKLKPMTDQMEQVLFEQVKAQREILGQEIISDYTARVGELFEEIRNLVLVPDGTMIWANKVIEQIESLVDLKEIDLVFTTSSPYSSHLVGYHLKTQYQLPWVADFRDEWSNNPYYDYKQDLRRNIEFEMEKKITQQCDKLVTVSAIAVENFIKTFDLPKKKVALITNGYDEEDFQRLTLTQQREQFKISYNGSFYLKINPYSVIESLNELIRQGDILKENILFECSGTIENQIFEEIQKRDVYHIMTFIPYMQHRDSLQQISDANLLLLIIGNEKKLKGVYTGKVFEYLRLYKPILAIAPLDGVVDELINSTESGVCCEYNDIEHIKAFLLECYLNWKQQREHTVSKKEVIKDYERKILTQKLINTFEELT